MKKLILILAALFLSAVALRAQEEFEPEVQLPAAMDSTLLGLSIFSVIGPGIEIIQSTATRQALDSYADAPALSHRP